MLQLLQGRKGAVATDVLNRKFGADAPNKKWVTNVTEFHVGERKIYLSPVMDLFDRQIIAYTIGSSLNLELTNTSLQQHLTSLSLASSRSCTRTRDSSINTFPDGASCGAPARSNQCHAKTTATTTP